MAKGELQITVKGRRTGKTHKRKRPGKETIDVFKAKCGADQIKGYTNLDASVEIMLPT